MGDLRKIHQRSVFNNPVQVLYGTFTTSGDASDSVFTVPKNFVVVGGWACGDTGNSAGIATVTMQGATNFSLITVADRTTEDVDFVSFAAGGPPVNDTGAETTIEVAPIAAAAGQVITVCIFGAVDDDLS